jgi:hypothetical protein
MDYYNEKNDKLCIKDSDDCIIDIIVKGNKIYKVYNYKINLENDDTFNNYIHSVITKEQFILASSKSTETVLTQPRTGDYIVIKSLFNEDNSRYWIAEYVKPEYLTDIS